MQNKQANEVVIDLNIFDTTFYKIIYQQILRIKKLKENDIYKKDFSKNKN